MSTIYLHIGLPKTATTSLQHFLFEETNQKIFAEHGICCPDTGCRYKKISYRRNAHFLVASNNDFAGSKSREQLRELYENGLDELSRLAERYDKIILSDESIWKRGNTRKKFWPRLKEDLAGRKLDIRVIVYFRRQDLWLESYFAQEIRAGKNSEELEGFIAYLRDTGYPLDYCRYMDDLAALFGKEKLLIRIFETAQFHGAEQTVYSDFLDIFGLSLKDGFVVAQEIRNSRYDGDLLECRRILNSLPEYQAAFHPLRECFDSLRDMKLIDSGEQFSYFGPQERERFLASFAESNQRLAKEYLGRQDGELFYETPAELPVYQTDQYELIRSVALLCARKISDLEVRNEKLEREIVSLQESMPLARVKKTVKRLLGKNE